ncbi:MAG: hypothetical protein WAM60_14225 [Candidatus Promineifilaceae bacterium]
MQKDKSDQEQLLALHQLTIEAHLQNDVEIMLKDEEDDYVVGNRGVVTRPTKVERRQQFEPYFAGTTFEIYRDEIPPIVKVSEDGTLGWVIAQVYVRGEQDAGEGEKAPLEFGSSWIELYEKRNGRWIRMGNVSNIKSLELVTS